MHATAGSLSGRTPSILRVGFSLVVRHQKAGQINSNNLPEPRKKILTTYIRTKASMILAWPTREVTADITTESNYFNHHQLISLKAAIETCNARKCPYEDRRKMLNY